MLPTFWGTSSPITPSSPDQAGELGYFLPERSGKKPGIPDFGFSSDFFLTCLIGPAGGAPRGVAPETGEGPSDASHILGHFVTNRPELSRSGRRAGLLFARTFGQKTRGPGFRIFFRLFF